VSNIKLNFDVLLVCKIFMRSNNSGYFCLYNSSVENTYGYDRVTDKKCVIDSIIMLYLVISPYFAL